MLEFTRLFMGTFTAMLSIVYLVYQYRFYILAAIGILILFAAFYDELKKKFK